MLIENDLSTIRYVTRKRFHAEAVDDQIWQVCKNQIVRFSILDNPVLIVPR
jgi:mannitol-1-phosphate/altronate dehydrogenase